VREVNKPAVFTGLYNVSTNASIATMLVTETAPVGTTIGRVLFTDPNTGFPWNVRNYGIVSGSFGSGFFAIDPSSGVLSLAPPGGLSWWTSPSSP